MTTLADIALFILPVLVALGGAVVFVRRRRRQLRSIVGSEAVDVLAGMTGQEFVSLVAAAFRQEGYLVVARGGHDADGAVDLDMYLGRDRYLVHCKQWQAARVGIGVLRDLFVAMRAERAVGCFIVTAGSFTDEARAYATGRAIRLVPADSLRRMIAGEVSDAAGSGGPPACPLCGKAMVTRVARQGEASGQGFWGCSNFPACPGVRPK